MIIAVPDPLASGTAVRVTAIGADTLCAARLGIGEGTVDNVKQAVSLQVIPLGFPFASVIVVDGSLPLP